MAKTGLLSPLRVERETKPGRYCDGGGLYLEVKPGGTKSWHFRYQHLGTPRKIGLGPFSGTNSLATARKKAAAHRGLLENGVDPQKDREDRQELERLEAARGMTFRECAETYIAHHEPSWRNPKHKQQWRNTLATYVYPIIGALPVAAIDEPLVLKILHQQVKPAARKVGGLLWQARPDTAGRVRGRIEAVLDWAKVNKYRKGENPARWRGNLSYALPKRSKVRKVEHFAALPYEQVGSFMKDLHARAGVTAMALEFLILTVPRTTSLIEARWPEIDEAAAVWTIPGERMKGGIEHRVPLSPAALEVLERAKPLRRKGDYIFTTAREKEALSDGAFIALLKRMGHKDAKGRHITAHGFRSTFRDWTAEETSFAGEVAEMALAHVVGDDVEAAYRRGDLLEKRRALMTAWAQYCLPSTTSNVMQMHQAVA